MLTGVVFDIREFAVPDWPGLRVTFFARLSGWFLCRLHRHKKLQSDTNMKSFLVLAIACSLVVFQANSKAQGATITIHADQVLHTNSLI